MVSATIWLRKRFSLPMSVRVKMRNTLCEQMLSDSPPNSDIARCDRHFAFVPRGDIAGRRCRQLLPAKEKAAQKATSPRIININGSDVSPMVMTMMMASTPSIVVPSTTVTAPAMTTAVAVDLDDVSADKCIWVCTRHRRRGENWSERESASRKSDQ